MAEGEKSAGKNYLSIRFELTEIQLTVFQEFCKKYGKQCFLIFCYIPKIIKEANCIV